MKLYFIAVLTAFCLLLHACPALARDPGAVTTDSGTPEKQGKKTKTKNSKKKKKSESEQSYNLQPVVVTGTKTAVPLSETTRDIHVVTNQQMQTLQQVSIPSAVSALPGVMVQNLGGPGQYTPINIRGAGSQYVQMQWDGFPLRDAADTQNAFQYLEGDMFGQCGINRIEVLNGTNSVLDGTQAMGGVVNIIPDKWGSGFTGELMSEAASDGTFVENGGISYGNDKYYFNLNPTYITTNGISNGGPDSYYYNAFNFNGSAGIKLGDNMSLQLFNIDSTSNMALTVPSFGYYQLNAQNQLIPNLASPSDHEEALFDMTGVNFNQVVSRNWNYSIKYAYSSTGRDYYEPQGNFGDTTGEDFTGSNNWLEMLHNVRAADWLTLTGGFDFDQESYQTVQPVIGYAPITFEPSWTGQNVTSGKSWYGYDLFGMAQTAFFDKSLLLNAGLRFNDHQDFPSKMVEEVSGAYIFKKTGTKIHSSVGTGYMTPSLYEIFGGYVGPSGQTVTVGNPDLRPETDTSYDAGITQPLFNNRLNCDVTWFYMDFSNIIYYNGFTNLYENGAAGKTSGIEASIQAKPSKYLNLAISYTYAYGQIRNVGSTVWQRNQYWPTQTLSFVGTVYPTERFSITMQTLFAGNRIVPLYNVYGEPVNYNEPADVTCNLIADYTILKNYEDFRRVDVFMKITNLFNADYTVDAYQMPGRWFWGGVRMIL